MARATEQQRQTQNRLKLRIHLRLELELKLELGWDCWGETERFGNVSANAPQPAKGCKRMRAHCRAHAIHSSSVIGTDSDGDTPRKLANSELHRVQIHQGFIRDSGIVGLGHSQNQEKRRKHKQHNAKYLRTHCCYAQEQLRSLSRH